MTLTPGDVTTKTDATGNFVIENLAKGEYTLSFEAAEFEPLTLAVRVDKLIRDLNNVILIPENVAPTMDDAIFAEFDTETLEDAQSLPSSLSASKDVFNNIASYKFSEMRFNVRGYDENHPATVSDIIAHLNEKGIQAVRQTVYADTNALIDAGIDIVVVKSTQNQYFMGSRLFEYPELKMLTDAVASSKIISARKSEELVQKLCRLTSTHQAEQLRQLASLSSRVKPDNEQVYYIIDAIQTAILEKRQIQFQYYEYTPEKKRVLKHGGYLYQLDPYALEWKNDHYYLIGFSHKHQRMAHFRVDRLSGIKILPSGFTPDEDFDVAGYTNKIVDMFAADRTVSVELLCENKLMKTIIDHYGEAVPTRTYDEEHFTANIEVDPSGTFYGWVFKFMGGIQIIAPHECVEEMKRIAHRFL